MKYYGGKNRLEKLGYQEDENGVYYYKNIGKSAMVVVYNKTHQIEYVGKNADLLLKELGGFAR